MSTGCSARISCATTTSSSTTPRTRYSPGTGIVAPASDDAENVRSFQSPEHGVCVVLVTSCDAVIFDMDGIIIDSEENWERARLAVVAEFGGTYHADVARDVMGMSPPEWSRYLRDRIGIPLDTARIEREVVRQLVADYQRDRPFYPGAIDAVRAVSARWPTAIASSSGRDLIDLVVRLGGLQNAFAATVSGAEVAHGKPAPDVYLKAAELLGANPRNCVAIEDSAAGIRAAKNAGMWVIAVPNAEFPPAAEAVALADVVLARIAELTPAVIDRLF